MIPAFLGMTVKVSLVVVLEINYNELVLFGQENPRETWKTNKRRKQ
jgi:hypothetical protein